MSAVNFTDSVSEQMAVYITQTIGSATTQVSGLTGRARVIPFTAAASGLVISVGVYVVTSAGSIRTALYADNAGSPGALLSQSASVTAIANRFNAPPLVPSVQIIQGTQYWVGVQISDDGLVVYIATGSTAKYVSQSYGAFPNPFGTPGGDSSTVYMRIAYIQVISHVVKKIGVAIDSGALML